MYLLKFKITYTWIYIFKCLNTVLYVYRKHLFFKFCYLKKILRNTFLSKNSRNHTKCRL